MDIDLSSADGAHPIVDSASQQDIARLRGRETRRLGLQRVKHRVRMKRLSALPLVRRSSSSDVRNSPRDFTMCTRDTFPCTISTECHNAITRRRGSARTLYSILDLPLLFRGNPCPNKSVYSFHPRFCKSSQAERERVDKTREWKESSQHMRDLQLALAQVRASILSSDVRADAPASRTPVLSDMQTCCVQQA